MLLGATYRKVAPTSFCQRQHRAGQVRRVTVLCSGPKVSYDKAMLLFEKLSKAQFTWATVTWPAP